MAASMIVDLTGDEDTDQIHVNSAFIPSSIEIRAGLRSLKTSPTNFTFTSVKRKRSELEVHATAHSNSATDATYLKPTTPLTMTPSSNADNKRAASASSSSSSFRRCGSTLAPRTTNPTSPQYHQTKRQLGPYGACLACWRDTAGAPGGTRQQPINLADDDDLSCTIRKTYPVGSFRRSPDELSNLEILASIKSSDHSVFDDEDETDITGASETRSQSVLSAEDFMTDPKIVNCMRKLSLDHEAAQQKKLDQRVKIPKFKIKSTTYAPGKSVELQDGTFLRIMSVSQNGKGEAFLSGHHLVRENFQGLMMPNRRNEVVWIQPSKTEELDTQATAPVHEVSIQEVSKSRDLVFTNQRFPAVSSRNDDSSFADATQDVRFGPLFCRWKRTTVHDSKGKIVEGSIQHLNFADADNQTRKNKDGEQTYSRIADPRSRFQWRGCTTYHGGSHKDVHERIDLEGCVETQETQKYSFADSFCGAGGTSRGAVDAGLSVKWGFDMNAQAMATYRANFAPGGTDCRQEAVHEFLRRVYDNPPIVDILHISPPCQPFSPARTIVNVQRDEMNQAALFSVWQLLESIKPRIVTIEQTEGLVSRHKEWFSALVNIFTNLGYSTRWKIIRCEEYGVPQTRKRLVIIASGPGEKLPLFPQPTHSNDDSAQTKKPLVTIADKISHIPAMPDHNTDGRFKKGPKVPFNPHTLAKTLTTNGGIGNYHPSGARPYSVRELASLQTFPLYHRFTGARGVTAARIQIGNAVPPVLAKALFKSVVQSLKESDRVA